VKLLEPGAATPRSAKIIGGASLLLWIGVIIAGRMLTFYRPIECMEEKQTFPFYCVPQRAR
jgi:hypothetical protein